jgi:hypothetical protein
MSSAPPGSETSGLSSGLPDDAAREPIRSVVLLGLLIVAVAVLVSAAHWPALSARTLWIDDDQYLVHNKLVRNPSWFSAGRFFAEVLDPSTVGGYYHPLAMISLMLDSAMGGRPDNLRPFHRTSLVLHVLNSVSICVLLFLLFGEPIPAALGGLLFGIHPLTVESIPWVGERKTLLATFFALACLILYVRYARRGNRTLYGGVVATFVLGLLSKPTITPLPLLMLLLDYWPLGRLSRRAVLEKVPLLVIAGVSSVITVISHGRTSPIEVPRDNPLLQASLVLCHNLLLYLGKVVRPGAYSSPHFFPEPFGPVQPMVLAGIIGTSLLVVVVLISTRWTPALLVGLAFFLAAIFPAISIVKTNTIIASDKYAYFPLIGLLLPFTWLLARLWRSACGPPPNRAWQAAFVLVFLCVAMGEFRATRRYLAPWEQGEKLLRHLLSISPRCPDWHFGLGNVLAGKGKMDDAVAHLKLAVEYSPGLLDARHALARVLLRQGRKEEAFNQLMELLRLSPGDAEGHFNLANLLMEQGRLDEAIIHFSETVRLKPDMPEARNNLGAALLRQGKVAEAIPQLREALRLKPDFPSARRNLAAALERTEKTSP